MDYESIHSWYRESVLKNEQTGKFRCKYHKFSLKVWKESHAFWFDETHLQTFDRYRWFEVDCAEDCPSELHPDHFDYTDTLDIEDTTIRDRLYPPKSQE